MPPPGRAPKDPSRHCLLDAGGAPVKGNLGRRLVNANLPTKGGSRPTVSPPTGRGHREDGGRADENDTGLFEVVFAYLVEGKITKEDDEGKITDKKEYGSSEELPRCRDVTFPHNEDNGLGSREQPRCRDVTLPPNEDYNWDRSKKANESSEELPRCRDATIPHNEDNQLSSGEQPRCRDGTFPPNEDNGRWSGSEAGKEDNKGKEGVRRRDGSPRCHAAPRRHATAPRGAATPRCQETFSQQDSSPRELREDAKSTAAEDNKLTAAESAAEDNRQTAAESAAEDNKLTAAESAADDDKLTAAGRDVYNEENAQDDVAGGKKTIAEQLRAAAEQWDNWEENGEEDAKMTRAPSVRVGEAAHPGPPEGTQEEGAATREQPTDQKEGNRKSEGEGAADAEAAAKEETEEGYDWYWIQNSGAPHCADSSYFAAIVLEPRILTKQEQKHRAGQVRAWQTEVISKEKKGK
eukprot:gene2448-2890_t